MDLGVIADALINAFPTVSRLERMLLYRLNKSLERLTSANGLDAKVHDVLVDAEANGELSRLIVAARESNPGNGKLAALAETFPGAVTVAPARVLEGLIDRSRDFMDAEMFWGELGRAISRVCRVEVSVPGGYSTKGTGFLVGPSLVMTNYHVIEHLMGTESPHESVVLRFDYRRRASGELNEQGTTYQLDANEWLVDHSRYSKVDFENDPKSGLPAEDELDYALLRVAGAPGNDSVGKVALDPGPRGWFTPLRDVTLGSGEPLLILQHPMGSPLKLDVHHLEQSHSTRLRYTVNTDIGSSGSPVFDGRLRLVGLHHSGDPKLKPTYNEGIPFGAIWRLLSLRKLDHLLGQPLPKE